MALRLPDRWMWDFWFAQEGSEIHIFYLQAPRSLKEEHLRHWNVSIGHAVSQDLVHWDILPDALAPSRVSGAWDNYTTWTGSIIQRGGTWYLFYTGSNRAENGLIQRIGLATSDDLIHWDRHPGNPIVETDPRWYETLDAKMWHDQAWRDPFVFRHEGKFHAFITARCNSGDKTARGVIGHAISSDLFNWQVQIPVTEPGEFGYLEVPQLVKIRERWYLFFSVTKDKFSISRLARKGVIRQTGTHYLVADHPLGPFKYLTDNFLAGDSVGSHYSGKIIRNPQGNWVFIAFRLYSPNGQFIGELSDPIPLQISSNGTLTLADS